MKLTFFYFEENLFLNEMNSGVSFIALFVIDNRYHTSHFLFNRKYVQNVLFFINIHW